jgi:hypothetical protein
MAERLVSELEGRRIERMLERLFAGRVRAAERFSVDGWQDADWYGVSFTLATASGSFAYPVEARVARKGLRPDDAKTLLLDLLGHLFDGYLQTERAPFSGPIWESVDYCGRQIWLRGQELSPKAEADGSVLLNIAASSDPVPKG